MSKQRENVLDTALKHMERRFGKEFPGCAAAVSDDIDLSEVTVILTCKPAQDRLGLSLSVTVRHERTGAFEYYPLGSPEVHQSEMYGRVAPHSVKARCVLLYDSLRRALRQQSELVQEGERAAEKINERGSKTCGL